MCDKWHEKAKCRNAKCRSVQELSSTMQATVACIRSGNDCVLLPFKKPMHASICWNELQLQLIEAYINCEEAASAQLQKTNGRHCGHV